MIIFQHKQQPWRTLSGAYQRKGWFFHHVRTFVMNLREDREGLQ